MTRPRGVLRASVLAAWAAFLAIGGAQIPTFRAGIDVVRVDAVVVDAKGMPIRGLKAQDFTVLEDGKPRPIVGFDAIDLPIDRVAEPGEAAWVKSTASDVVNNKVEDRRLFMIVIDDATMKPDPRAIARAKAIGHEVVSRLSQADQAAVVFTQRSGKAQPFTADQARLRAAINSTGFGLSINELSSVGSAGTLAAAAQTLFQAPQPRKTLVLISGGVPFAPETIVPVLSNIGGTSGISGSDTANRVLLELHKLIAAAAAAHVNVYAFDVNDFANFDVFLSAERNYLRIVAENTGGRATIANEDPVQGVTQMLRESSVYYLIGFTSASATPGRHRVEVQTMYPGAKVLARTSFEVAKANAKAESVELKSPLASLLPVDRLPMRATATALPGSTPREATVAIALGINQPTGQFDGTSERVTVQVAAYETTGRFAGGTKLDVQLVPRPNASGRAQYDLLARLPLRPGRYQLRLAANVQRQNVNGSVFVDLDVPDFGRDGVAVAPLVLSMSPAPPAAPANAFAGLLPVVPTSHRVFGTADRVSILARIVQGGKAPLVPVTIAATVLDTKNQRVFGQDERITPEAGINRRFVDYTLALPIESLPVGDYLLTVKASTRDSTNEKTLRFSRR